MGPHDEMSPYITWTPQSSCLLPVMQWGRGALLAPDRRLPDFRTVRNTHLVFLSHPVYCILTGGDTSRMDSNKRTQMYVAGEGKKVREWAKVGEREDRTNKQKIQTTQDFCPKGRLSNLNSK